MPSDPQSLPTFALVTLGCTKNVVDSEGIDQTLAAGGHRRLPDPSEADVVIVNTCGFIGASRQESVDAILGLAASKRPGQILIATGCLVERHAPELVSAIPELDALVGVHRWPEMEQVLSAIRERPRRGNGRVARSSVERLDGDPLLPPIYIGDGVAPHADLVMPARVNQGPSAYLKISDGCDAGCAFCAIPGMKGGMRSKSADDVLREAIQLTAAGVREIVLVAQDTTAYGRDRGERSGLARLLERLADEVPDLPWIRVMYAYPQFVSDDLLGTMARLPQVCRYLDVPLQHAHPDVLRRMKRPHGAIEDLVARIRDRVPNIALRTTFIVGFPGETEAEFEYLERAVGTLRFDRVGVFAYSREEGTPAYEFADQVPEPRKERRRRELMLLARRLSREINDDFVGRELDVLVEGTLRGRDGHERLVARSYRDAPEVDGVVLVDGQGEPGNMLQVRVTAATDYDLTATVVGQTARAGPHQLVEPAHPNGPVDSRPSG
jgi:ribosomal protein S12 methylthiotransferase